MAYMKKAPLMFDGPTPVNMAPAMAGLGEEETIPPPSHEAITSLKARKRVALAWGLGVAGVVAFLYLHDRKTRKAGF